MNPEEQKMLQEALALSRENNEILKKLYRSTMWGHALRALYWILIIGITVGTFYFLQPYVNTLQGVYGDFEDTQNQFKDLFGG
ncbi:MAG: hypothetical protein AAB458_01535 [Patescibacteria group bacterium]